MDPFSRIYEGSVCVALVKITRTLLESTNIYAYIRGTQSGRYAFIYVVLLYVVELLMSKHNCWQETRGY